MLMFAYYLLKVFICSGTLYGYYFIALRDKIFHKWNRFYLLTAVILSLTAPLIKIDIREYADKPATKIIHLLQVVNANDETVYQYTKNVHYLLNVEDLTTIIYSIISGLLMVFLFQTLYKIARLKNKCDYTVLDGINFIVTDAEGTPFSFFNNIFWNDKIDINTATGKQILNHEIAHVHEKHSYDKIFLNITLIVFWINPFFWLVRKELNIIHEFAADKKSLVTNDTRALAAMILQATYPRHQFALTNNFFYSPLKRRFAMLIKNQNTKVSYVSRMLVLPIAAMLFFAFTLKMKPPRPADYAGKRLTVIIDAGHGGNDQGAQSENGIYEKNITLSIAKKVKELNSNKNINIILSRNEDVTITPQQRVDFAKSVHADIFISIHLDAETDKSSSSGLGILIPKNENTYLKESKLLGADINESFKNNYQLPVPVNLQQPEKGVWVLKANAYPAVLISPGFISTQGDLRYLTKSPNQYTVAKNILTGIEKYSQGLKSSQGSTNSGADSHNGIR